MEDLFEALFEVIGELAIIFFPWGLVWFGLNAILPGICYVYFFEEITILGWVSIIITSICSSTLITIELHERCN